MREFLQVRRARIVIAVLMMICLLVLLVPQVGNHGSILAYVLLFPVFLFGLLDLPWLLQVRVYAGRAILPQAPVLSALFQRPLPSFN
jgi:membrane associated rhomboid family serine protease